MSFVDTAAAGTGLATIVDAATSIVGDIAGPYANIYSAERQIGGIIPDVTIREVLSDTYTITNHPVEGGTPISDHYFANPKMVEMSVGWSDCTGGTGYVLQVFQAFRALAATRQVFSVDTGKCSYDNMLLGEATTVTDPESETTLMVTVRLQEVIISQTSSSGSSDPSTGTNSNQTDPQTTGTPTALGTQNLTPLPYFASGNGAGTASLGTGSTGLGGSSFNLSGPAV